MKSSKKPKLIKVIFDPQENISAYELAQIVPFLISSYKTNKELLENIQSLPKNCRRHIIFKGYNENNGI
jgi:hypothetical protein